MQRMGTAGPFTLASPIIEGAGLSLNLTTSQYQCLMVFCMLIAVFAHLAAVGGCVVAGGGGGLVAAAGGGRGGGAVAALAGGLVPRGLITGAVRLKKREQIMETTTA